MITLRQIVISVLQGNNLQSPVVPLDIIQSNPKGFKEKIIKIKAMNKSNS